MVVVDAGMLATFGLGSLRGGLGQSRRCREGGGKKKKIKETQLSCSVWRRLVGGQRRSAIV